MLVFVQEESYMDKKEIAKLKNNIDFAYKRNENTPRVALYLNYSLNNPVENPGVYSLMSRLFMQGTTNRTAQQLSEELDKYAIEFSSELKLDYLKFKFVCLNEDFSKALEIFTDIIKNTTFEDFDKERAKMEGEIIAELDSPKSKVVDNYYKNIYDGHHYGYTSTKILENLPNLKKEEVIQAYKTFTEDSRKVVVFVGDLEYKDVYSQLDANLGDILPSKVELPELRRPVLNEAKELEILKPDMNQAHIIKGWLVPSYDSEDYAPLALLNIIMGASGLSSRLFLELRDKKGLAYVVRSSYDVARLGANFSIYIATEPKNIEVSLAGFEEEIHKIKSVLVGEEELENAKNNLSGKWAFMLETNQQQANWLGHYGINGLGFCYRNVIKEKIRAVTAEQIKNCANKYFNDKYVISILKP